MFFVNRIYQDLLSLFNKKSMKRVKKSVFIRFSLPVKEQGKSFALWGYLW